MKAAFLKRRRCSPCQLLLTSSYFSSLFSLSSPPHSFFFLSILNCLKHFLASLALIHHLLSLPLTFFSLHTDLIVLILQPLTPVWPQLSTTTRWLCWRVAAPTPPTWSRRWRPRPEPAAPCTWTRICRPWTVSQTNKWVQHGGIWSMLAFKFPWWESWECPFKIYKIFTKTSRQS